ETAEIYLSDAVMLSAETAAGAYPIEADQVMDLTAQAVENDALYPSILESQRNAPEETTGDAIMAAVHEVTETLQARAIICWTKTGSTALRAARERPSVPAIALTARLDTARRLAIVWGLHCVHTADVHRLGDMIQKATRMARREGFAEKGARIVITAGIPFGTPGATNVLHIAWIQE
ncbi:MAG: pyruvate kinase alpha/beta domain-containing protein, partial [Stellaceae bacterium]